MNELYLHAVTLGGLHYKRTGKGGGYSAPLPFPPEADAYRATFDKETLTLTWLIPNPPIDEVAQEPTEGSYTFTPEEIEAGKVFVTTPKPAHVPARVSKLSMAQAITATNGRRLMTLPSLVPAESKEDVEEFLSLSAYIVRSHPMIPTVAALLGFATDEDIDAVFVLAEKLAYKA
jgi:hypothetical protein